MVKGFVLRRVVAATLSIVAAAWSATAAAQVYKCAQPGGSVSYQGTPCPTRTKPPEVPKAGTRSPVATDATTTSSSDPYAPNADRWTIPAAPVRNEARASAATTPTAVAHRDRNVPQPESPQQKAQDADREALEAKLNEENKRALAFNRMQRCNYARQQLGVVSEQVRVFHLNNKGERVFVDDKDRQGVISGAQQRVADECN